ncbi:hypothetical protein FQN50_003564 [Emmonsiellopsis sp. PD_5]|nr:hypothetical protein FQN50_003564 [Emmonsiellopsis sp. PD_5]
MVRIEELPDDFNEALDLNKSPDPGPTIGSQAFQNETPFGIKKNAGPKDPTVPDMPPGMASVKSHTADEILEMMNKTPLFMTDLHVPVVQLPRYPSTPANIIFIIDDENLELEAIRALQYEGTRPEVAQGFRESGNELTREKKWSDGKEFYTKAIAVLTGENKWEKSEDPEADAVREKQIAEACYTNRALCNLELKNYRSTTLDCASALKLNPKNIKAYYRSTCALLALDKIDQAEDACARGLQLDPANKSLQLISEKIAKRKTVVEAIAARRAAEEEKARREKLVLNTALRARDIKVRNTEQPPDMEDAVMHLSPDPLAPTSALVFPAVFLYPMDAQSDFIKAFAETESVADHLGYIFPLPWDERGDYRPDSVECFMETVAGGLIKVGKKMSLLRILSGGKVEVVDGLVRINVVPGRLVKGWVEEMKARRGGS